MASSSGESRRVDIKAMLADPELSQRLVEGATDFIRKVEGIRWSPGCQHSVNVLRDMLEVQPSADWDQHALYRALAVAAFRAVVLLWEEEVAHCETNEFTKGWQSCIQSLKEIVDDLEGIR